jgi:hypothetical protein
MHDFTFGQGPNEPLRGAEIYRLGDAIKGEPRRPLTQDRLKEICLSVGINPLRLEVPQPTARRR